MGGLSFSGEHPPSSTRWILQIQAGAVGCAQEPSQGDSCPFGADLTHFFPQECPAALHSWGQLNPVGLSQDLLLDLDVPRL